MSHHDGPITGHLSQEGTLELITQKYTWKNIAEYVQQYVQGCYTCAHNKNRNWRPRGLLQSLPIPEGPWLWTQSDFIT
jgi:hypothetical protein